MARLPDKRPDNLVGGGKFWFCATCGFGTEAAGEFLNTASGINEALFPCEEWVASSANTNFERFRGRTGLVNRSTGARNGGGFVAGMNIFSHGAEQLEKFKECEFNFPSVFCK